MVCSGKMNRTQIYMLKICRNLFQAFVKLIITSAVWYCVGFEILRTPSLFPATDKQWAMVMLTAASIKSVQIPKIKYDADLLPSPHQLVPKNKHNFKNNHLKTIYCGWNVIVIFWSFIGLYTLESISRMYI